MTNTLIEQIADFLPPPISVVSIVGAGGKTTCMYDLARLLIDAGKKVLITTTTKLYHPEFENRKNWQLHLGSFRKPGTYLPNENSRIDIAAKTVDTKEHKLIGFLSEEIDETVNAWKYDYVLVEADGAKQKPIKAPAGHEPVIPRVTALVIGMVGLDCLGKTLNEVTVHRAEYLSALTGQPIGSVIDKNTVCELITSGLGLFKNVPQVCNKVAVLNKADTPDLLNQGIAIRNAIMQKKTLSPGIVQVLVGTLNLQIG